MRLALVALLSIVAGASAASPAPAHAPVPFDGAWMDCQTWRGAEICEYTLLAQRGTRVCGLQRYFATNAYYEQRFVGTVKANVAHIEKICGDPGSETDTYCAGRAPSDAAKVGWGSSDEKLLLCNGRLLSASGGATADCAGATRQSGMPRVRTLGDQAPEPQERAWLTSCAAGAE
jgi:hypothetical protein